MKSLIAVNVRIDTTGTIPAVIDDKLGQTVNEKKFFTLTHWLSQELTQELVESQQGRNPIHSYKMRVSANRRVQ